MLIIKLFVLLSISLLITSENPPNIIFFLLDDVGLSDLSYNSVIKDISTPNIDFLANSGIQLTNYYVQSLCTPSRASLLTGRYAVNAGLTSVLVQGTPAGLPSNIPTISELLQKYNYYTAMVGKWHLGHAQSKMTPAYRGFDFFTGIYMWDADSYTKQMYERPWEEPMMIDWIEEYSNGTFTHYAEPKHSTIAITNTVQNIISNHPSYKPLFIYVPYTAAHSPLQPEPQHLNQCLHIKQTYRQLYCGMVVGIDESIKNITYYANHYLGSNTIFIVSSDNGGSPWFGGLNVPYRGSKNTPFEGGIKVPGYITEISNLYQLNTHVDSFTYLSSNIPLDQVYGSRLTDRKYNSLFHISDWFPTIASLANIPESVVSELNIDGLDLSNGLPLLDRYVNNNKTEIIRSEVLLEFYLANESVFQQDLFAYRINELKYIEGVIRDPNYYYSSSDHLINNTARLLLDSNVNNWFSDKQLKTKLTYYLITYLGQSLIDLLTYFYGEGPLDTLRIVITHTIIQKIYTRLTPVDELFGRYKDKPLINNKFNYTTNYLNSNESYNVIHDVYLYNLTADPYEEHNLVDEYPGLLDVFRDKINQIKLNRPPQQKVWYQLPLKGIYINLHLL
mmetsp:Transcript_11028/g.9972  ORF Transcript_11028/g.9972 Transcript_11028/m.9972 type:complete len:617 (-) Transcript_11028:1268-3118(-)